MSLQQLSLQSGNLRNQSGSSSALRSKLNSQIRIHPRLVSYYHVIRAVILLLFTLIVSDFSANLCHAQGVAPQTVTLRNGLRFEGEILSTQQISEAAFSFEPYLPENILVINDGLRLIHVSKHQIANLGAAKTEIEFDITQRTVNANPGYGAFVQAGPFDRYGHRKLTVMVGNPQMQKTYVQGITKITPRFCELDSLVGEKKAPKDWHMSVSTKSIPKDVLREVLLNQIVDKNNPNRFYEIAEFFRQANDFRQASKELLYIESRFPNQKDRIRDARNDLAQAHAKQRLAEVKNWIEMGHTKLGLEYASLIAKSNLAGETQAEFQDVRDTELKAFENLKTWRDRVMETITEAQNLDPEQKEAVRRFRDEMETDLNRENLPRLAAFQLAYNDKASPIHDKLALAISGWLLGSNNAEDNFAVVQSLFQVRDLIREYLQLDTTPIRRSEILNALGELEGGTPPYIDKLLKQMKPIESIPEVDNYTGEKPIELWVETPPTAANPEPQKHRVLVHLPTPYDPYKKYPLLLTLPGGGQPLEQNLNWWCGNYLPNLGLRWGHAARNGYIVAAVDWRQNGKFSAWQSSAIEHAIVTRALKQCLRKFAVDSDRVFLSGHGRGADGAYDIGVSHPEHWAGVIGFSGKFDKYVNMYGDNDHPRLPFYCVVGTKNHEAIRKSKDTWNKWIRSKKFNDVIVVYYQGRINEFFLEEIPDTFRWMEATRRRPPIQDGFEFTVRTLRPFDNYYWFFEMHSLPEDRMTRPVMFNRVKRVDKMTIAGSISNNTFRLEPKSYSDHDSTLWLSPEFIDFDKDVVIKQRSSFKGGVKASAEVLLNDVLRRADREHPFWSKLEFKQKNWQPQPTNLK